MANKWGRETVLVRIAPLFSFMGGTSAMVSRMYSSTPRFVVVVVVFVVVAGTLVLPSSAAAIGEALKSDLCEDDGTSLHCDNRQLIHIRHVTCGDGSHACAPEINETMFRLCEDQRTCAGLGLKNIMRVHCLSDVISTRHVHVHFSCPPAPPDSFAPPCRTNLCSNGSMGLACPTGSVIHVRRLACLSDLDPCPWATYALLYTLCEGSQECEASGLRMLMSTTCDVHVPRLRNVFVDYLCVPQSLTYSKCNGQHKTLTEPFGLLMSPGFVGGRGSDPTSTTANSISSHQCNWIIARQHDSQVIQLTVHVAQSNRGASNCTLNSFLQLQYRDCDSNLPMTVPYCYLRDVSKALASCGPVKVSGWLSDTSAQTDRFLVSYRIVPKGSGEVIPGNMSECTTPIVTTTPTTTPVVVTTPRPTVARARNYGPGGTMFDYSDTIRQTADNTAGEGEEEHPAFQFKLVILYVFFGVVIIALVIALVYVLVSYRGISRRGRRAGDSSEKAALWRNDDTPLDTFNHNSHASLADAANSATNTPNNRRDSQVVATVHAESTDEEEHRFSSGSGFSSFLPGKDTDFKDLLASLNPYATVGDTPTTTSNSDSRGGAATLPRRYSGGSGGSGRHNRRSNSLKMNGDLGDIYETIDAHQYRHNHNQHSPPQQHPHYDYLNGRVDEPEDGMGEEHIPLVQQHSAVRPPSPPLPPPPPSIAMDYPDSEPVDHYIVNNDEYALVRKHRNASGLQQVQMPQPGSVNTSRSGEYTNVPCVLQERNSMTDSHGSDPTYDSVEFRLPQDPAPVVNFRPTSGPYDRDRNSKPAEQNVSPSSGASRHRWDEDL